MHRLEYLVRTSLTVLALLLLQTTFIPFMSIAGFLPDLLLIWLVHTALRRGQIEATIAGFAVGLLQDVASTKFLGLAALSKTVAGFAVGYFFNENMVEPTLGSYRFPLLVLFAGMIHNALYFFVFLQGTEGSLFFDTLGLSAAVALYTAVISLLPMFFFSRRYQTVVMR